MITQTSPDEALCEGTLAVGRDAEGRYLIAVGEACTALEPEDFQSWLRDMTNFYMVERRLGPSTPLIA